VTMVPVRVRVPVIALPDGVLTIRIAPPAIHRTNMCLSRLFTVPCIAHCVASSS